MSVLVISAPFSEGALQSDEIFRWESDIFYHSLWKLNKKRISVTLHINSSVLSIHPHQQSWITTDGLMAQTSVKEYFNMRSHTLGGGPTVRTYNERPMLHSVEMNFGLICPIITSGSVTWRPFWLGYNDSKGYAIIKEGLFICVNMRF